MLRSTVIARLMVDSGGWSDLEGAERVLRVYYDDFGPAGTSFAEWNYEVPDSRAESFLRAQPRYGRFHWPSIFSLRP